jgi:predicted MPP superfamily phosphohydrolase
MNLFKIILFFVIAGVAEYYAYIVVKSGLRTFLPVIKNVILATYTILTILSWCSFIILRSGVFEMPHTLKMVFIAFSIGLILSKALILILMLGDDIRRGIQYLYHKWQLQGAPAPDLGIIQNGVTRSVFIERLALLLGIGMVAGFIHGISNRYKYQVKKIQLKFKNLPIAFDGLRIVHISDIHCGSFDNPAAVQKGVDLAMAQKPDIILFTGDLVNDRSVELNDYQSIFSQLKAPLGVYSVLGNHDYGDYVKWDSQEAKVQNLEALMKGHKDMGWQLLMNEHVVLEKNNEKIAIIGIENWGAKAHFPKYGSMKKACEGLNDKQVPFNILLSHDPSHWTHQVISEYPNVDLTLSGHTHGMQFGIEIPGFKWSPSQFIYKCWAGIYNHGKQYIYVNRGFGFLGYQGRFGIMPEITVIDLKA